MRDATVVAAVCCVLMTVAERISLVENDAQQNYNVLQREAVARWMSQWLLASDRPIAEPTVKLLSEEEARCAPESGLYLPAIVFSSAQNSPKGAVLYIHEKGESEDAGPGGPIEKLADTGRVVMAVDLRGAGETQSSGGWGSGLFGPDVRDVLTAYVLGKSYVGMRAEDILICARLLVKQCEGPLDLVAVGNVSVPALHAAAYDLPDLARVVGDRLTIEQPLNAQGEPVIVR
ncbi:MAG: hypothetical protein JW955_18555 [Sedimentisphaerales bacterium]|nr:hypothetical protein [Sedimentisphaerales bacterium]